MSEPTISSFSLLFARLAWMIFGPLALFLLLSSLVQSSVGWFGVADLGFFGVLGVMLGCRAYEFRSGEALTASGDPMTTAVLARYSVGLLAVGFLAWAAAKAFALGML